MFGKTWLMAMLADRCQRVLDSSCIVDPLGSRSPAQEQLEKSALRYFQLVEQYAKTEFLMERDMGLVPGIVGDKKQLTAGSVQFNIIDADIDTERQKIVKAWVEEYGLIGDATRASNPRSKEPC
jgi:hypothetical protein